MSNPYYSTDRKTQAQILLEKYGSREDAVGALLRGSCTRESAEQLAVAYAKNLGVSIADFMGAYDQWIKGKKITLPSPEEKQNQPPH
jgi:hypothetical protein